MTDTAKTWLTPAAHQKLRDELAHLTTFLMIVWVVVAALVARVRGRMWVAFGVTLVGLLALQLALVELGGAIERVDVLLETYRRFVDRVRAQLPDAPIYFIGVTPSPRRWEIWETARELNRRVDLTLDRYVEAYRLHVLHRVQPLEIRRFASTCIDEEAIPREDFRHA